MGVDAGPDPCRILGQPGRDERFPVAAQPFGSGEDPRLVRQDRDPAVPMGDEVLDGLSSAVDVAQERCPCI